MSGLELSVIVPCHNEEATVGEQLDALTTQQWHGAWEIVVVDNNSTDRTAEIAASYANGAVPVRVVAATGGRGVAYARNVGARSSSARSVAFCDGDDVVFAGWTAAMGEALRDAPLVVGTLDVERLNELWLAQARPMGSADALPHFGDTAFARGNNTGMHRDVWERLDGYREDFEGLEDIEFSLRARAAGILPTLAPDATVAYRFRPGLATTWSQGVFYGRGRPELAAQAKSLGFAPPARSAGLKSWVWLIVSLPTLATRTGRYAWMWTLANRWGVIRGSVARRRGRVS
jgi:GT2 family glycosyltransferase